MTRCEFVDCLFSLCDLQAWESCLVCTKNHHKHQTFVQDVQNEHGVVPLQRMHIDISLLSGQNLEVFDYLFIFINLCYWSTPFTYYGKKVSARQQRYIDEFHVNVYYHRIQYNIIWLMFCFCFFTHPLLSSAVVSLRSFFEPFWASSGQCDCYWNPCNNNETRFRVSFLFIDHTVAWVTSDLTNLIIST